MTWSSTRRSAPSGRSSGRRSACWSWMPRWACTTRTSASRPRRGTQGCGLIVVVNKWDLVEEKDANTARRGQDELIAKAPFLRYVPFVYVSALTGQRVRRILDLILEVAEGREQRVPTAEVNRVLSALLERNSPPQKPGEEVKLLYASQIARGAADLRHREQPSRRRAGRVSALPGPWVPRGVAVRRLAAPAQVHGRGQRDRSADGGIALAAGLVPARRGADQLSRGAALPGHRPARARQPEPRRHQPVPGARLAIRDSGRTDRCRQGTRSPCWSSRRG